MVRLHSSLVRRLGVYILPYAQASPDSKNMLHLDTVTHGEVVQRSGNASPSPAAFSPALQRPGPPLTPLPRASSPFPPPSPHLQVLPTALDYQLTQHAVPPCVTLALQRPPPLP